MLSKSELWIALESLIKELELELFDLDMPSRSVGTLRIFIARNGGKDGVSLEQCARVSKTISGHPDFEGLLDLYSLEVSSPGVNRRLQRPEHYQGAVGERVKLTLRAAQGQEKEALVGVLSAIEGEELTLKLDASEDSRKLMLGDVLKARVDYLFLRLPPLASQLLPPAPLLGVQAAPQ